MDGWKDKEMWYIERDTDIYTRLCVYVCLYIYMHIKLHTREEYYSAIEGRNAAICDNIDGSWGNFAK